METRVKLVRWLRLPTAAIAAGLAILALMILPDLVGLLPCAIPGSPLEWSAVALVVVFRKAHAFVAARTYPWPESWGRNWSRKVRETRSSSSQKRSERGQEVLAVP